MATYLIFFNDEWVPDLTLDELRERGTASRLVLEEMRAAGVFLFSDGGLDASSVVGTADPASGTAILRDGPFTTTAEHFGGLALAEVDDDATAMYWAGRIAEATGWAQEVHRFPGRAPERRL